MTKRTEEDVDVFVDIGQGNHVLTPTEQTWATVIRRAVVDYVLYRQHPVPKLKKIGKDAEEWLFGPDTGLVNSFTNVCHYLNVEPSVVRGCINNFSEETARRLRGMGFGD
jgi:hypothetical protein